MFQKFINRQSFQIGKLIKEIIDKIPYEIKFILLLFLTTRLLLTATGIVVRNGLVKNHNTWYEWNYSKYTWLDIWSVWDSGWYLDIAENGYSPVLHSNLPKKVVPGQSNVVFFPFYPLLMRTFGKYTGGVYNAGVLISNISLILSAYYLYKLTRTLFSKDAALRSVLYLFVYPTSFILSGIFSESLFLALAISSFYYAINGKWILAGILGFFLSLTRHVGVFFVTPLICEYLRQRKFNLRLIKPDFLFLLLFPFGTLLYLGYVYFLTNHSYFYFGGAWGDVGVPHYFGFINSLRYTFYHPTLTTIALFSTLELILIISNLKRLNITFQVLVVVYLLIVHIVGGYTIVSMPRFMLVLFPTFLILATISKKKTWNVALPAILFVIQVFFMSFWSSGLLII